MKIAHVPFVWHPDPVGGTEVYVKTLAAAQRARGHDVTIIVPGDRADHYEHDGLQVYRYAVDNQVDDLAELYSARTSVDDAGFERILVETRPDVLHVHGYGRAVTRRMLQAAHRHAARIVFTYHTPTATCMRGTLMRWGKSPCDGILDADLCAACLAHSRGVPRPLAGLAARLRMTRLVKLRHDDIRDFLHSVDHIIATSDWVLQLLERLGVSRERITLNRQGTPIVGAATRIARAEGPPRLVFLGRFDRTKGLDILIDALRAVRAPVELHVFGIAQGDDAYTRMIERKLKRDARIHVHAPVAHESLLDTIRQYDALVVPSQWFETGPLVVLEAFAAGVPVIGARLGGIAELVRDGVDGLLVEAQSRRAWTAAIERVATDTSLIDTLRAGVRAPRTMSDVAAELDLVYKSLMRAA